MSLKHQIAKLDEVAEPLRQFYVQEGNSFFLQVEGMVAKAKVDEFRESNINLTNKLKTFTDVGATPEEYTRLKGLEKTMGQPDKALVDAAVEARTKAMKEEHTTALNTLTTENKTMKGQLEVLVIDNAVRAAASKVGALPVAVDDIVLRAKSVFRYENGQAIPYDSKNAQIYGPDGSTPMNPEQWVTGLKKTAAHLFPGSQGGGGNGGGPRGGKDPSKMSSQEKIKAGLEERAG